MTFLEEVEYFYSYSLFEAIHPFIVTTSCLLYKTSQTISVTFPGWNVLLVIPESNTDVLELGDQPIPLMQWLWSPIGISIFWHFVIKGNFQKKSRPPLEDVVELSPLKYYTHFNTYIYSLRSRKTWQIFQEHAKVRLVLTAASKRNTVPNSKWVIKINLYGWKL